MATKTKKLKTRANKPALATEGYESFLDSLIMIAVGIKSCSCALDRTAYGLFKANCKRPLRTLGVLPSLTYIKDNHFDGEVRFVLRHSRDEQSEPEKSLTIEFVFEAHFHTQTPEANKAFAKRFVESELPVILLPYARHFVSDITARMQIGTIVLPLRLPPTRAQGQQ
jgi:preprotein translocase subunit SecB